jgi:tetratricopeptide (TPR) repeat protein
LIGLLTSCVVIVTSRQRLTTLSMTTGARRVRVEPMPDAEAVALLSAQLGAHQHIDDDDRAHLVRLSGGLPLVIKMLADHIMTSKTPQLPGFASQLDRRQLITYIGEDGDGSAIAHTVFSWSYRRLEPSEKRLFRLLGLHPGPEIGVDVACACDGRTPVHTKQSFGKLVGAHLLERPAILDRYGFHDLIHEFAVYCAECDEPADSRKAAERRMLNFYLHSAERANRTLYPHRLTLAGLPFEDGVEPVDFTGIAQAKSWFDQERTNLTAAVRFASTHDHHDYAWRLADAVATFFDRYGYYQDSLAVREFAVLSARAAGHRDGETSSLVGLGMLYLIVGKNTQAQQCLDTSLHYAVTDHNERAQAATLHHLGRLQMQRGDPAKAVDHYQRSLTIARRIDDESGQCWTLCRIGDALRGLDQHNEALVHLHEASWFAQRIGDQSAHASVMATIGSVHRDQGDYHTAMAYAGEALVIANAIPDFAIIVQVCLTLAETAGERGQSGAVGYALQAVEVCRRTGNVTAEARAYEVLGDVQSVAGAAFQAIEAWQQAADLYDRIGNPTRSVLIQAKIDEASGQPG